MAEYNQLVRDVAKSTGEALDQTAGFGAELLNADGSVNSSSENGAGLLKTLMGIRDATADAAASGGDMGKVFGDNQAMFEQLAQQAGVSVDDIRKAIGSLGYDQRVIALSTTMEGTDQVTEDLAAVWSKIQFLKPGEPKVIELATLSDDAAARLDEIGFKVDKITENGVTTFRVSADTEASVIGLDAIMAKITQIGGLDAVPRIDLNTTFFDLNEQKSRQLLDVLGSQTATPGADLIIDKLINNKNISVQEITDLANRVADPQVRLQIENALRDAGIINTAIDDAAKDRVAKITVQIDNANNAARDSGYSYNLNQYGNAAGGRLPFNASGGRLPVTGPGTNSTDGILGVGSDGVPTTWVDKGEWIINGRSSSKHDRLLAAINRDDPALKSLPGFAEGGRNGIDAALGAGKSKNGNKYVWGGTGPDGFDCSGFVGWLQQIAMGIVGSVKRLYTTYDFFGSGSNGFASLLPGLGPTGTQFQVGVSQEHMAATVAGQPAESGGSHGDSRIGSPAVGASDPQFPKKFHLPNELIAGGVGSSYSSSIRKKVEWDDKSEIDLQSANVSVTQANEDLAEVQAKFAEGKKTQADVDQAMLKVSKAEQKVVELQKKKDDAANGVNDGPAPQAPALAKAYSEAETTRLEAQIAVDDANERRNEIYADIEASENDRLKADMDLAKAQTAFDDVVSGKTDKAKESGSSGDYSLKGILKTFGTRVLDAGMGALEAQDPFGITSSRWWTTDFTKTGSNGETDAQKSAWSKDEIDGQLPVTPGAPGWLEGILKAGNTKGSLDPNDPAVLNALAGKDFGSDDPMIAALMKLRKPKVFDQGGWLQPGEMGINLSTRPEPIFNSPDQLRQFAGTLAPAAQSQPAVQDLSMHFGDVSTADFNEFKAFMQLESRKRSRSFQRR